VNYFLRQIAAEYNQPVKAMEKSAVEALQSYNWSGNIRELWNVVERLIIFSGATIGSEDIEHYVLPNGRKA
jgi:DNA-binding NtrC family response regulator